MCRIEWQQKAKKQLDKIRENKTRVKIFKATERLVAFPNCPNVKSLVNHQHYYRLWVGDYRVIFAVVDAIRIISIEEAREKHILTIKPSSMTASRPLCWSHGRISRSCGHIWKKQEAQSAGRL